MYKNQYEVSVIVRARQTVTLDHEDKTLCYGAVDDIIENEYFQIMDATNIVPVGEVEADMDEEVYEAIHKKITAYESGEDNEIRKRTNA